MNSGKYVDVSVFQKSKKGNHLCGDSYFFIEEEQMFLAVLADGLGSGEIAKESSQIVVDIVEQHTDKTVEEIVKICNKQLIGMRGAVIGILKLDFMDQTFTFSTIGNIGIIVLENGVPKKRNIPSSGYLGSLYRSVKVMTQKLTKGTNFIMFSDGVMDKELSKYFFKDDNVERITETYAQYSDRTRHDDTTLMAIRYRGEKG
ncbi:SpoIIE family protein phosphatase [Oceanobacillus sp. J11TS1]|uniref:SpoIIE family protein phosphatase n=1 Tax=Oceanobacillus sp. J11TS1 TaxID=2807191 RepID=UPI001B1C1592|nr:SpoIIE family protein phosphatase [Oceanobacillus sp. J11TS1]GIO24310.1 phosphoserine phosphatase RsbX [Oceanobacillus sp. J11TS1]